VFTRRPVPRSRVVGVVADQGDVQVPLLDGRAGGDSLVERGADRTSAQKAAAAMVKIDGEPLRKLLRISAIRLFRFSSLGQLGGDESCLRSAEDRLLGRPCGGRIHDNRGRIDHTGRLN